jgi:hypothetical protein
MVSIWHVREKNGSGWGNLTERNHLEDLGLDGIIISQSALKKQDRKEWTEFMLIGIGPSGRLM